MLDGTQARGSIMTITSMMTTKDLIEDWIVMRSTLVRQLEMLKSEQMHTETNASETTRATVVRVETCIAELTALLKEHPSA